MRELSFRLEAAISFRKVLLDIDELDGSTQRDALF
jgi:hypothetical protein